MLDTCVLIDALHGAVALAPIPRGARRTSVAALWEFTHGPKGMSLGRPAKQERREWLKNSSIDVVSFARDFDRSLLPLVWSEECPPSAIDCVLAADCLARNWPIVTSNVGDFDSVPGLRIVMFPP